MACNIKGLKISSNNVKSSLWFKKHRMYNDLMFQYYLCNLYLKCLNWLKYISYTIWTACMLANLVSWINMYNVCRIATLCNDFSFFGIRIWSIVVMMMNNCFLCKTLVLVSYYYVLHVLMFYCFILLLELLDGLLIYSLNFLVGYTFEL